MIKYLPLLVLLVAILLFTNKAHTQTASSSCTPSGNTAMIYKKDALRLAIKRVNDINSVWKDSVDIPAIYVDSISRALYAIENMGWSPLKDTIRTLFGYSDFSTNPNIFSSDSLHIMHAGDFNNYKMKKFSVTISSTANWFSAWSSGNYANTPNDSINYLVKRYGLQIQGSGTFYNITSPQAVNIQALSSQFKAVSGVVRSDLANYFGDGQYIKTETDQGNVVLTFVHACGDCPSGCTYGRIWKFKVNSNDCSVTFISATNWGGSIGQVMNNQPYTCISQIMPVTFASLNGRTTRNGISLEWEIATESGIEKYVIERSANAKDFTKVGEIKSTGNGVARYTYAWLDALPLENNYYRIKSIGLSGEIKYTSIINLKYSDKTPLVSTYPNPVTGRSFNLKLIKASIDTYSLKIASVTGQTIYTTQLNTSTGSSLYKIQLPLTTLPGKYLLYVSNQYQRQVQSLVIE